MVICLHAHNFFSRTWGTDTRRLEIHISLGIPLDPIILLIAVANKETAKRLARSRILGGQRVSIHRSCATWRASSKSSESVLSQVESIYALKFR